MYIENTLVDPVLKSTVYTHSGQSEQGDVFAEIFSNNIELNSSESNSPSEPSLDSANESDDHAVVQEERSVNETDQETQSETVGKVDSNETDRTSDSQDEVDGESAENPQNEENSDKQPETETPESSDFLNQLASDPNAQQTQQQVAVTVKTGPEIQQNTQAETTQVKVVAPEPIAEDAGQSKVDVKTLATEAPTGEKGVDAADEKRVLEINTKVAGKQVVSSQTKVEVEVDQDGGLEFEEVEPEQIKPMPKKDNESTRSDSGHRQDGAPKLDLNQSAADLDAKAAASGMADGFAKDKNADLKKGETTLVGAMRETSVGKIDVVKGVAPAAKSEAESLVTREQVEQVVKAAKITVSRGSSQVQLRLDPPELGHLRIVMKQTASGLQVQVQATTIKAQQMLEQTSTQLRSALESQGFQSVQIEVQLRTDLRNEQGDQQADQFNQRQSFEQGDESSQSFDETLEDQWSDANEEQATPDEALESSTESQTPHQWQEMEFTHLNVVA